MEGEEKEMQQLKVKKEPKSEAHEAGQCMSVLRRDEFRASWVQPAKQPRFIENEKCGLAN